MSRDCSASSSSSEYSSYTPSEQWTMRFGVRILTSVFDEFMSSSTSLIFVSPIALFMIFCQTIEIGLKNGMSPM